VKTGPRLFCGIYPCGLVFADRHVEVAGDYKRLAFLPYRTLVVEFEKDCPAALRAEIAADIARMALRAGDEFQISTSGQTIILGGGK
jgi:hypothetical protein